MLPIRPFAALLVALLPSVAGHDAPRPAPVSAHNCYPFNSRSRTLLEQALRLGIDNIEIDLGWDAEAKRLLVGHDAKPREGATYPELENYLVPSLETHWEAPRPDAAPTVLTIDWKTADPEAVAQFKAFLDAHADWFSSAPKADPSPLTKRRLTVCFTGDEKAKDAYDALIPAGGVYRAFKDRVYGGGDYRTDVSEYAPKPASAYHRFLTLHWGNVERGGPPEAGDWTPEEAKRLRAMVAAMHQKGYRIRFYCLDAKPGIISFPYRFADEAAAVLRWKAAAEAGVDWVASDDYEEIVKVLNEDTGRR